MIVFIKGNITEKNQDSSIHVDVNGIGYQVFVPFRISEKYKLENNIFLYTFHKISESTEELYGFEKKSELEFFKQLISVSGIGTKSALAMSEMEFSLINNAIEKEDLKFLTKITGIGKKTASRLILELKGKLIIEKEVKPSKESIKINNIKIALENLGFEKRNIENLLENISEENLNKSDEELIKWALSKL